MLHLYWKHVRELLIHLSGNLCDCILCHCLIPSNISVYVCISKGFKAICLTQSVALHTVGGRLKIDKISSDPAFLWPHVFILI